MIPVIQTILHSPSEKGNCLPACIASILEKEIDEIPEFQNMRPDVWFGWLHCWLDSLGYTSFDTWGPVGDDVTDEDYFNNEEWTDIWPPEDLPVIAGGLSPRSTEKKIVKHCVIWRGGIRGKIIHDPHPSGDGLIGRPSHFHIIVPKSDLKFWRGEK